MPNFDRTGPRGEGPMSGQRQGLCRRNRNHGAAGGRGFNRKNPGHHFPRVQADDADVKVPETQEDPPE